MPIQSASPTTTLAQPELAGFFDSWSRLDVDVSPDVCAASTEYAPAYMGPELVAYQAVVSFEAARPAPRIDAAVLGAAAAPVTAIAAYVSGALTGATPAAALTAMGLVLVTVASALFARQAAENGSLPAPLRQLFR